MNVMLDRRILVILASSWLAVSAAAQEDSESTPPASEVVATEQTDLVIYESLSGIVQSSDTREIKTDLDEWKDLEVSFILPEGTSVKAGDKVLQFDTEELDRAIETARWDLQIQELAVEAKRLGAEQAEIVFEIDSAANERDVEAAREDYEYYETVLRPQRLEDLDYTLRSAEYSVEYAREELDQLMKMYNEDELTEESEQIVLKRAQRGLESAERRLKQTRRNVERQRRVEIAREDLRRKDELRKQVLAYEKKKLELKTTLEQARVALAKAELEWGKAKEKLERLEHDRQKMVCHAEIDGVLMYGECKRGKWISPLGSSAKELKVGSKLPVDRVVLTVVNPAKNVVRTEIPEDKLAVFTVGVSGTAVLKANSRIRMPVALSAIGAIPLPGNKFDAVFEFGDEELSADVRPPLNCDIVCQVYHNAEAVVLPKTAVFSDDGVHHFVFLANGDRRDVETGFEKDGKVEITAGIEVGDEVLKERPKP